MCASCGKEITAADIVKGFEYDKDQYVIVTEDDFEKIKTEKDRSIEILHFTDLPTIRPIFYDKTYHTLPEKGGEKAFELLRRAMKEENKVGIAKTVMGNKETLLCIIPTEDEMLIETMFFQEEIKAIPKEVNAPDVKDTELNMAKKLIESMDQPFQPELYQDEYQERLRSLIADKIAGKEIVASKTEKKDNVIDLMDALKASIEAKQPSPKKPRTRKPKGA